MPVGIGGRWPLAVIVGQWMATYAPDALGNFELRSGLATGGWSGLGVSRWRRETGVSTDLPTVAFTVKLPAVLATRVREEVRVRGIGIHIRRGAARDRHVLGAHGGPDAFPPTIWISFTGFRAEQRIRRLLATPRHTSLNGAARALGTKQSNLIVQIRRLERAVGAELLRHGPEHSTITLTGGRRTVRP